MKKLKYISIIRPKLSKRQYFCINERTKACYSSLINAFIFTATVDVVSARGCLHDVCYSRNRCRGATERFCL